MSTASPLHIAAAVGTVGIAKFLIDSGASVECTDRNSWTPLHFAADRGCIDLINLLVKNGANVNAVDACLSTPLMLAAKRPQNPPNMVSALIDYGSDLTLRSLSGHSPLYIAALVRNWDAVICLLSYLGSTDSGESVVHGDHGFTRRLSIYAPMFVLSFLLNYAPYPGVYEPNETNILSGVASRNDPVSLRMLMRRLPEYLIPRLLIHQDMFQGTPLYTAATTSANEVIDMLLDAGAQLELEGGKHGTPLMGACATGRLKIVKMLVSRGAKTSYVKDGQVIDVFSAAKNHPNVRRWLLVGRYTGLRFIMGGGTCERVVESE